MNIILLYVEYLIFGDGKSGQNILRGFSLVGALEGYYYCYYFYYYYYYSYYYYYRNEVLLYIIYIVCNIYIILSRQVNFHF